MISYSQLDLDHAHVNGDFGQPYFNQKLELKSSHFFNFQWLLHYIDNLTDDMVLFLRRRKRESNTS